MSFRTLKYLSFAHSAVYLSLLTVWLIPGLARAELVLGWCHGVGWIVMSLLCIDAVRRRVIPLWLGVMVAVDRRRRSVRRKRRVSWSKSTGVEWRRRGKV